MADAITIKALQDASLDAKSLEEVVNGNEAKQVTTRKGETYPSVKKAIKMLFENGGIADRFKTLADLQASPLVDGAYALVADDVDDNNGIYIKEEGVWAKSKYDPKVALLEDLSWRIEHNDRENILEIVDVNGFEIARIDEEGLLFLHDMSESVQAILKGIANGLEYNESSDLLVLKDINNQEVVSVKETGTLNVKDASAESKKEPRLLSQVPYGYKHTISNLLKDQDLRLAKQEQPMLDINTLVSASDYSLIQVNEPSITRISENQYFMVVTYGDIGDFGFNDAMAYILTVADDYSISYEDLGIIIPRGSEYSARGATCLYLHTGKHKGRILVHFNKTYGTTKDDSYYMYSDDLGQSWSDHILINDMLDKPMSELRLTVVGPGNLCQLDSGRIVLPYWHGDYRYPSSQAGLRAFLLISDDGGETYRVGARSNVVGSNECVLAPMTDGGLAFITRDASLWKHIEFSYDDGETLVGVRRLDEVVTTKVQSSMVQARNLFNVATPKLILCTPMGMEGESNPYTRRANMGLHISYDNGDSFSEITQIIEGYSGYSTIDMYDDTHILVVYIDSSKMSVVTVVVNLNKLLIEG